MIYQHATKDRDLAIAQALGGLVQQVRMNSPIRPGEASGDAQFLSVVARVWPDYRQPGLAQSHRYSALAR